MKIRLPRLRYLRIVGFALGAVAVTAAAVVVTASASGVSLGFKPAASSQNAPSDSNVALTAATSSAACNSFMSHFAQDVGKSQAQINAAFQKAIGETLADEVKSGQLAQAQADAIKQKLANQTPCAIGSSLSPRSPKGATIGSYMQGYETAAAAALGISDTELKTDLANGQSLSTIAAAKKISEADFRTRLIANLTPSLDKAVTDKKLTSGQEQAIINHLKTGALPLWNKAPQMHKPSAAATPAATPTPKTA